MTRQKKRNRDNGIKCDFCGRYISVDEIINRTATHIMVEPDSHFGPEVWESHHNTCWKISEIKKEKR